MDALQQPNPHTPFAFVDPQTGHAIVLERYMIVGSFAVLLWDLVDSVRDDYRLVFEKKFGFMTGVFLTSRFSAFSFLLLCCLITTAPLGICSLVNYIACSMFTVYRATTSCLFYARINALYPCNRAVKIVFATLLLVAIGGAAVSLISTSSREILPTNYCATFFIGDYWQLVFTAGSDVMFDLCVCVAVTYKIRQYRVEATGDEGWRAWIWPKKASHSPMSLMNRFLQDSQIYFIVTASVKLPEILIIILFSWVVKTTGGIQIILVFPDAALTSIIASKVYRNARFGKPGLLHQRLGRTETPGPTFLPMETLGSLSHARFASPSNTRPDTRRRLNEEGIGTYALPQPGAETRLPSGSSEDLIVINSETLL
ncbi:hypothetical protein CPB83DRAFT_904491 [Crepidotus variabilis]|uniref:Uncharacterized protein n=1 Tax=Crepidotus variabilis TaxID=179855 RepID=A0A9P6JTA2_9AGAR|nr:hypothetical protein CPB83DRAFT_904491 [Crepidotus variabilis]